MKEAVKNCKIEGGIEEKGAEERLMRRTTCKTFHHCIVFVKWLREAAKKSGGGGG